MIRNILVALLLVCLVSGLGSAETYCWAWGDGEGAYSFENTCYYHGNRSFHWRADIVKDAVGAVTDEECSQLGYPSCSIYQCPGYGYRGCLGQTSCTLSGYEDGDNYNHRSTIKIMRQGYWHDPFVYTAGTLYISFTPFGTSHITGNTSCVTKTELKAWDGDSYEVARSTTSANYDFETIDDQWYQLKFYPSLHQYAFTTNGSNIIYDYDGCSHTQYHFKESCGNLIPDSEGFYTEVIGGVYGGSTWFSTSTGILELTNSSANAFDVFTHTFIGQTGWRIDPVVSNSTYTLENPNIVWGLKVIVQNESDGELIDGAIVMVNQTCYCTDGYSTRNKRTVSGMVNFGEMSLQDAGLVVMKDGYKSLRENTTGYSVTLSGRSNFSSKTWIVKLANNSCNNSSSWYETNETTNLYFRDINNNITSKILDSDANVYLHYDNNNSNEEAMTLKFQSSSTHTYFIDEQSWTIPHGEISYKTIANSDFTPWDYSYRAVMYNNSIYGWNVTIPLTVRNATKEDQHYENLTTNLLFRHARTGKVDYRDDMSIGIHARSNNTTLMQIDIELWKDGVYIACKNLTSTILAAADQPYYYIWNPSFDYVSGSNYSVRMYGFDRTLLETDYVDCITDDTTRKNKLTIIVKDRAGGNLNNAYIYLEDWGSLPTGSTYYNAYEGITNGDYRYKATKSGYSGGGWDEVTLDDADKIVTYVLTEDYTNTSSSAQKFTDDDIKGFFFPLMFFLLICIVLGGLKYVAS